MRRICCIALMTTTFALVGCPNGSRQVAQEKPIPDPLLVSKKPVEGKQASADGSTPSGGEIPPAPEMPYEAGLRTPTRLLPRR